MGNKIALDHHNSDTYTTRYVTLDATIAQGFEAVGWRGCTWTSTGCVSGGVSFS